MVLILGAALLLVTLMVTVVSSLRLTGIRILPDRVFLAVNGWVLVFLVALALPVALTILFVVDPGRQPLGLLAILALPIYSATVTWLALKRVDRERESTEGEGLGREDPHPR